MTIHSQTSFFTLLRKIHGSGFGFCTLILFLLTAGCSSEKVDSAASQPAAAVESAVADLNESGAEIVLDSAGDVVAVKLPQQPTPDVIATLTSLSKLKRVDASETDLQQTAFADLQSKNPEVKITLPR